MPDWPASICVFCGASRGLPEAHVELARHLGRHLSEAGVTVIYGGGKRGLMGSLADAVIESGGRLVGVIPRFLVDVEVAHEGVGELLVVESMHARKHLMAERADAFLVLPGGIGTLEEAVEILTWGQLGLHAKPLLFLDPDGYWDALLALLNSMERLGYLRVPAERVLYRVPRVEEVLETLRSIHPAVTPELIRRG